jgi:phytoene dehydrogenase-like protein
VPGKLTKKQIILEYSRAKALERIGAEEIRALENELRARLGPNLKPSPSYIARVLRAAGKIVEYHDRFADPPMAEPYASRLRNLLQFHDFTSAEASLRKLDEVYREYRAASDRTGAGLVRSLLQRGKLRAGSMAENPRVSPHKRAEKREIATWFRVWLETPDLFFDWLELRKASPEFRQLFTEINSGG